MLNYVPYHPTNEIQDITLHKNRKVKNRKVKYHKVKYGKVKYLPQSMKPKSEVPQKEIPTANIIRSYLTLPVYCKIL